MVKLHPHSANVNTTAKIFQIFLQTAWTWNKSARRLPPSSKPRVQQKTASQTIYARGNRQKGESGGEKYLLHRVYLHSNKCAERSRHINYREIRGMACIPDNVAGEGRLVKRQPSGDKKYHVRNSQQRALHFCQRQKTSNLKKTPNNLI